MLTKADKLLVAFLLTAALAGVIGHIFLFESTGKQYAQISANGKIIKTVSLSGGFNTEYTQEIYIGDSEKNSKENSIDTDNFQRYNGYNIIEIKGGKAHIREADCPDQVCVKSGWISFSPQQIVCLPNRVVVKIISDATSSQVDAIAR